MKWRSRAARRAGGFSLVEMLVVITIIALLANLLAPAITGMMQKADETKCLNNLKELVTAAHFGAQDNDNKFPYIESDPRNPIYQPTDNAKSIYDALKPYGITQQHLQCPTDMRRGAKSSYATYGASYFWYPFAADESEESITIYSPRGAFPRKLSRVQLAADWEALHQISPEPGSPARFNVAFADGHLLPASTVVKPPSKH